MEIKGWFTPPRDVMENYTRKCKLFSENDELFKNFKGDVDYGKVLSGDEREVAEIAYQSLERHGGLGFLNENLVLFKENDLYNSPTFLDGYELSPSTLRYVNSAWDIKMLLKEFKPKRIVEIGGGYGGLCKILSSIYDFDEYTNKDLPEAEQLFRKYISQFGKLIDRVNFEITGDYDLFIADSSLAECDEETQMMYIDLARRCPYIYLVYNTLHVTGMSRVFEKIVEALKNYEGIGENNKGVLIISLKRNENNRLHNI